MGVAALCHVGSSWTRTRTHIPCTGRRILNHCTTREALGRVILAVVFSLSSFEICPATPFWLAVSAERSAVNLMGIPLYVICCFSLAAFNIFSFYLIFDSLINMCLGMFLLGFILYGTLCASWT